jgi:hypothetical protein
LLLNDEFSKAQGYLSLSSILLTLEEFTVELPILTADDDTDLSLVQSPNTGADQDWRKEANLLSPSNGTKSFQLNDKLKPMLIPYSDGREVAIGTYLYVGITAMRLTGNGDMPDEQILRTWTNQHLTRCPYECIHEERLITVFEIDDLENILSANPIYPTAPFVENGEGDALICDATSGTERTVRIVALPQYLRVKNAESAPTMKMIHLFEITPIAVCRLKGRPNTVPAYLKEDVDDVLALVSAVPILSFLSRVGIEGSTVEDFLAKKSGVTGRFFNKLLAEQKITPIRIGDLKAAGIEVLSSQSSLRIKSFSFFNLSHKTSDESLRVVAEDRNGIVCILLLEESGGYASPFYHRSDLDKIWERYKALYLD